MIWKYNIYISNNLRNMYDSICIIHIIYAIYIYNIRVYPLSFSRCHKCQCAAPASLRQRRSTKRSSVWGLMCRYLVSIIDLEGVCVCVYAGIRSYQQSSKHRWIPHRQYSDVLMSHSGNTEHILHNWDHVHL